jgi:hypothetical protein
VTWSQLEEALARRPAELWWRDDDAGTPSRPLERLLALSKDRRIPLSLAVVPREADAALFRLLHEGVSVLQHGTDHRNRAAQGEKKTEYPPVEPLESALARIADGLAILKSLGRDRVLPVLAPPWNRLRKDALAKLPAIGIRGVSAYGPRASAEPVPGLRQVNTHVDIVAWRDGRRFVGEAEALALAVKSMSGDEPVGLLTHHAVHDAAAWEFLERLFSLRDIRWLSAAEAFSAS